MAKITYYLGAGASYNSCPILNQQAELMIKLARFELTQNQTKNYSPSEGPRHNYVFEKEELNHLKDERDLILWYIGYFGKKALEFNTVDTFARKLYLTKQIQDLRLLKMSVSVFFDLWENFYELRYQKISHRTFKQIDSRYTALFSTLLENGIGDKIQMNESFNFISWNYDLQLEKTFKSFLLDDEVQSLDDLNQNYFKFKIDNESLNNVYHLNGHRGFFLDKKKGTFELNIDNDFTGYWNHVKGLLDATKRGSADFDQYIKYAWEHDLNSNHYKNIFNILKETEVLIIIGYSFPTFNRLIDQLLFSKLNRSKLKKIIYQDPSANSSLIENLFEKPSDFKSKIEILNQENSLTWFHLPNEHFITQKSNFGGVEYEN